LSSARSLRMRRVVSGKVPSLFRVTYFSVWRYARTSAHRTPWTKEDVRELKAHSKARTPLPEIAKKMKRTERALRRKAGILGIGLGHNR
jgi:hypothetical protein